jgi:hypothetical protein
MRRLLRWAAALLLITSFYVVGGWAQHEIDNLPSPVERKP